MAGSPREHLIAFTSLAPRVARSVWVGGVVLAIGLAGTAVWAISTKRLYRSESVVVYERGVQSGALGGSDADSPRQVSARLQDALTSRQRLEGLVKKMGLYANIVEQRSLVEAIDEMRKHLAMSGREGYAYRITFDADTRDAAQKVLDALVKDVVSEDTQRRSKEAEEMRKFLDAERKRADDDLKGKEAALSSFITQHPQLALETGSAAAAGGLIRANQRDSGPAASGGEIASLEMQAANLEDAIANLGRHPAGEDPVLAAAHARAVADLQVAQAELTARQAQFTDEHPDVKAARRRVAEAESAVRRSEAALKAHPAAPIAGVDDSQGGRAAALKRALQAIRLQIQTLHSRGSGAKPENVTAPRSVVAIDTEWTRLNRDVAEARERQGQLEARQFQAQLAATLVAGGQGGRLTIADPAFRPLRPVAGGRFKIALAGASFSLFLAFLAISGMAWLDDRLYGVRDIERVVEEPIVVVVPKLTDKGG